MRSILTDWRFKAKLLSLAKDMSPPKPSLLLLEMVELGELLRESPSPSDSPGSRRLLGRNGRCDLKGAGGEKVASGRESS